MKQKTRKLSIRTKLLIIMGLIMIAVVVLLGFTISRTTRAHLIDLAGQQALSSATMAMEVIDANAHTTLKPGDESSEAYNSMRDELIEIQKACGVKYIFTLTTDGNTVNYVLDTDQSSGKA